MKVIVVFIPVIASQLQWKLSPVAILGTGKWSLQRGGSFGEEGVKCDTRFFFGGGGGMQRIKIKIKFGGHYREVAFIGSSTVSSVLEYFAEPCSLFFLEFKSSLFFIHPSV